MRALAILVIALTGCWSEARPGEATTPVQPDVAPVAQASRAEDPDPTRAHMRTTYSVSRIPRVTVWSGFYYCTQGITAMTLTLTIDGAVAEAIFEFGPHPSNPNPVQTGATRVRGPMTENADGSFTIDLDPVEWVVQAPGYIMVGLTATTDGTMKKLRGRMKSPSCGVVEVDRLN